MEIGKERKREVRFMKRNFIKNGKWFAHRSTLHSVKCDQLVNARRQPINLIAISNGGRHLNIIPTIRKKMKEREYRIWDL